MKVKDGDPTASGFQRIRGRNFTPLAQWTIWWPLRREQDSPQAEETVLNHWPADATDVKNWCHLCELCTLKKMPNPKPKAPLVSIKAGYLFHVTGCH